MPSDQRTKSEDQMCRHCGATDGSEDRIVVGELADINDTLCNECRTEELLQQTTLSKLEAEIVALQQLGDYSNDELADLLDTESSAIDDAQQRIEERVEDAAEMASKLRERAERIQRTASELRGLYR